MTEEILAPLFPTLVSDGSPNSRENVVYSFLIDKDHRSAEDLEYVLRLKECHEHFVNRYSRNNKLSKFIFENFDSDEIVRQVLSVVESLNPEALVKLIVNFSIVSNIPAMEYVNYQIHILDKDDEKIIPLPIIGFKLFQWFLKLDNKENNAGTERSRLIFDLRCQTADVEDSRCFYTYVIDHLEDYFDFFVDCFNTFSKKKDFYDFSECKTVLKEAIDNHFDFRLANPLFDRREIIFLDVDLDGGESPTFVLALSKKVEVTTSPNVDAMHPEYKATILENEKLFYRSAAKIKEDNW